MIKTAIVIPAHNEERRIGQTLDEYASYFKSLKKAKLGDFEIIVVLNACKDRTREVIEKHSFKELRVIEFERGGKGFAVIEGFKDALKRKNDLIGFVDADMATSPEAYYDLIHKTENCDGAIAGRYSRGSLVKPKPSFSRIVVSRLFNFLTRVLFRLPYRDTQCGAKVFKRAVIQDTLSKLTMTYWAFDVELLYTLKKEGYLIREIPTVWQDKKYSTINFMKAGPFMALALVRLRILNSPARKFIKLFDKVVGILT